MDECSSVHALVLMRAKGAPGALRWYRESIGSTQSVGGVINTNIHIYIYIYVYIHTLIYINIGCGLVVSQQHEEAERHDLETIHQARTSLPMFFICLLCQD